MLPHQPTISSTKPTDFSVLKTPRWAPHVGTRAPLVVTVNTNCRGGGAAAVARSIDRAIGRNGRFQTEFLYSYGSPAPTQNARRIGSSLLRPFAALSFRLFSSASWFLERNTQRYLSRIETADLVHLHNIHGYYLAPLSFLEKLNRPFVWTLHDSWLLTGRCTLAFNCDRWYDRGCQPCPHLDRAPAVWRIDRAGVDLVRKRLRLKQLLRRQPGYLVAPSSWLAERVVRIGIDPARVKVIPNSVDTEVFRPASDNIPLRGELGLPQDKFLILFGAARLSDPLKGSRHMLSLQRRYATDPTKHFVFLGAAEKRMRQPNCSLLGYLDSTESLAKVYAACDVFISTSLTESFGMCVLEAMASGLPVIAFEVGGIGQIVCPETAVSVPPGDELGLVRAIDFFSNEANHGRRKSMAAAARAKCERIFSHPRTIAQYLALYDELLNLRTSESRIPARRDERAGR